MSKHSVYPVYANAELTEKIKFLREDNVNISSIFQEAVKIAYEKQVEIRKQREAEITLRYMKENGLI